MVSPEDFDEPRREAVILVPGADAMVQDLGPYRSGCAFETDLLPGSALVALAAPADPARPSVRADGQVLFAFEGNAFGATHLRRYHERCLLAAARLSSRAPSIAYGVAPASALHPVARFDLLRRVFVELLDGPAIKSWSGDALEDFLPPRDLVTPTSDPAATAPLCALPLRALAQTQGRIMVWTLLDGTLLSQGPDSSVDPLTAWRAGDPGLAAIFARAGIEPAERMLLAP